MIEVSKVYYKGIKRIALKVDRGDFAIKRIKKITDCRWSSTLVRWHMPYTKNAYHEFKKLGIPYQIVKSGTTEVIASKSAGTSIENNSSSSVILPTDVKADTDIHSTQDGRTIRYQNNSFYLYISYHQSTVAFIKALSGAYWNPKYKCWVIKGTIENHHKLQEKFALWDTRQFNVLIEMVQKIDVTQKIEIYQVPAYPKHVCVKTHGYKVDVAYLKRLPQRSYDKDLRRWRIPHKDELIQRIIGHYRSKGTKVIYRLSSSGEKYDKRPESNGHYQSRMLKKLTKEMRPFIKELTDTMITQRYSLQTIRQYTGVLIRYIKFLHHKPEHLHTLKDVKQFLASIARQKVSESYININYSALKFYYERVASNVEIEIKELRRPRKGTYLPIILSKSEVGRMMKACKNLKHLTLLYTLYSSGMRLGEILNLKIEDIWWDRNQIHIRGGKGKKDRIVMLSRALKQLLEQYCNEYQPIVWVFEGADRKTQYSRSSVSKVVKKAAYQARITKKVTPHTIRHCFATHLLDGGTDVRYIQELLGHKKISTTLIYTHVTTRSIDQIESPLDQLDDLMG